MEKRGVVDTHTPDVSDKLAKTAGEQTPAQIAAARDDDPTQRLAKKAAAELGKKS